MKPLVLYHAGCWDGFCAAWVARWALGDIEAIPVNYGQPPPIDVCGRDVYILDFSYPRDEMEGIIRQSAIVVCLDHHKTAQAALDGLASEIAADTNGQIQPTIRFDMDKSGGRLAWEYFFPNAKDSPNWLVAYTEDRDLWKWALAESKAINANLRSYPLDFEEWDRFQHTFSVGAPSDDKKAWIESGRAILRREQQIVDSHVNFAYETEMAGYKILCVNATVLTSEIAGALAKDRPFGACYFQKDDGSNVWSLRSDAKGIDVSAIAKKFGGGGHKNAAGFTKT